MASIKGFVVTWTKRLEVGVMQDLSIRPSTSARGSGTELVPLICGGNDKKKVKISCKDQEFGKLKERLDKSIPKMYRPEVGIRSFVGLEDVKADVLAGFHGDGEKSSEKILLFGPKGSGKSHFANVICTQLDALLITMDNTTFHEWSRNLGLFTRVLADIAKKSSDREVPYVTLLLGDFDTLSRGSDKEVKSVISFLDSVQNVWTKHSSSKLIIIACSIEPWTLEKAMVASFTKKVYLRPLNFQERRQLIQKMTGDLLKGWGLDMTDKELGEVVKKTERFSGRQVLEMVEKAFGHPESLGEPLKKVTFELIFNKMLKTGGAGVSRDLLKKYDEFCSSWPTGIQGVGTPPKFENKGVQVEVKMKAGDKSIPNIFV